jgi:site-specific DNA-methyltransferase (adenine-specific)
MTQKQRRNGTKTSSFGTPGRFGHDSTKFYASKLYEGLPKERRTHYQENSLPAEAVNNIFCKSSERMEELPDSSIHLMVTSPPYNVGKDYDEDLTLEEYRSFLKRVMAEVYRVLVPGGRACINLANLGRRPYLPLHSYIIQDMLSLEFLMRGEIIWDKASSASPSTAWGSWKSAANPTLRDIHEYILIFCKESFSRPKIATRQPTITREEFLEFTKSAWRFPAEPARKVGHPAPFPVELPYRCIQLYTYSDEVVLDPFMGSGSTALAALQTNRKFVGYEVSSDYQTTAYRRLAAAKPLVFTSPEKHLRREMKPTEYPGTNITMNGHFE